ncbi:MAG: methyl-accepting chemotaxis protein [Terriglobales bacterium]
MGQPAELARHPVSTEETVPSSGAVSRANNAELYREWVSKIEKVAEQAALGNLEVRLIHTAEAGELAPLVHSVNHLLDLTDAFLRETAATLAHNSEGKFFRKFLLNGMRGSFRATAEIVNRCSANMAERAGALESAEKRKLDLADTFEANIKDVVAALASSSSELAATAQSLGEMAKHTSEQARSALAASEDASTNTQSIAGAAEQMTASLEDASRMVEETSSAATSAVKSAEAAMKVIGNLGEASKKIGGVVRFISQIASQTNLLALNATIEAARAGEAGKGFAIVASEVKQLARSTATATEEITKEIATVRETSDQTAASITALSLTTSAISRDFILRFLCAQKHPSGNTQIASEWPFRFSLTSSQPARPMSASSIRFCLPNISSVTIDHDELCDLLVRRRVA